MVTSENPGALASIGAPMEPLRRPIGAPDSAGLDLRPNRTYDVREYLDKKEAATVIGLHPKTIERAILRGELRAIKPAGKVRIHRNDLRAWFDSTVMAPTIHDI
jgi:excisionase family DNA binding protein